MSFTGRASLASIVLGTSLTSGVVSDASVNDYAILVSQSTRNDENWGEVVDALEGKYPGARVHVFQNDVEEARDGLVEQNPSYVAFVAKPEEITIPFLPPDEGRYPHSSDEEFNLLMNSNIWKFQDLILRLDDDPYPDAIAGIITGYDADSAVRLAKAENFDVDFGLFKTAASTLTPIVERGIGFSDSRKIEEEGEGVIRYENNSLGNEKSYVDLAGPELFERLNSGEIDLFVTSGHANHVFWESGWQYGDDVYKTDRDGNVVVMEPDRTLRGKIESQNPKVYWSPGSCQTTRIKDPDRAIALSWMNSAGVRQCFGYAIDTWHGWGGFSMREPLSETSESPTFFEVMYMVKTALIYNAERLRERRQEEGVRQMSAEEFGKIHDYYAFVGYGDPALEVRLVRDENFTPLFDKSWEVMERNGEEIHRLTFKANKDAPGTQIQPVFLAPERIEGYEVIGASPDLDYQILDNAVILGVGREIGGENGNYSLPQMPMKKGQEWFLEFKE